MEETNLDDSFKSNSTSINSQKSTDVLHSMLSKQKTLLPIDRKVSGSFQKRILKVPSKNIVERGQPNVVAEIKTDQVVSKEIGEKYKKIKEKRKLQMSQEMFEVLMDPALKKIYYDDIYEENEQKNDAIVNSLLLYKHNIFKQIMKSIIKTQEIKMTPSIRKFQKRVEILMVAFKNLKMKYYLSDYHRLMKFQ